MNKRKKKIPMRKCVVTGEMFPKQDLMRVVRTKEGEVFFDPTGKKSGRGAYLSKNKDAIEKARQKKTLDHHLQVAVPDSLYEELLEYITKEQESVK